MDLCAHATAAHQSFLLNVPKNWLLAKNKVHKTSITKTHKAIDRAIETVNIMLATAWIILTDLK